MHDLPAYSTRNANRPKRSVKVIIDEKGECLMTINLAYASGRVDTRNYLLVQIGTDTFNIHTDQGECYKTTTGERRRCTCLGFRGHGHCKHVSAIEMLQFHGKL